MGVDEITDTTLRSSNTEVMMPVSNRNNIYYGVNLETHMGK